MDLGKNADSNLWEITTERFVAFIDIMGFKDMVARRPHKEIYEMMKKIAEGKSFAETVSWTEVQVEEGFVKMTTYSDSIMVYSKDSSLNSMNSLISAVSSLTFDLFMASVPHKGSIAYGKMTFDTDNSIFFGQPLIDAYHLQEELNFYGIICHATAEMKIEELRKENTTVMLMLNYACPLKGGVSRHLTVFPMSLYMATESEVEPTHIHFLAAVKSLYFQTSGYLRKYIENTEKYLEAVEKFVWSRTV